MNNDNDKGGELFFGGVIVVLIFAGMMLKAAEACFIQLTATLTAAIPMLVKVLEAAGLVVTIAVCVVGGVYFTVKYVGLVKKATELRQYVEMRLDDGLCKFMTTAQTEYMDEVGWLRARINAVEKDLSELLKPATPATPSRASDAKPSERGESFEADYEEIDEYKDPDAAPDDEFTDSQPY